MQKKKIVFLLLCLCLAIASVAFPVFVSAAEESEQSLLSPGLCVIARQNELVMSTTPGGGALFSAEDFERLVGVDVDYVTVARRADLSTGQLTIGSLVLPEGQKISRANLSRLSLVPMAERESDVLDFSFTVNGSPYEYLCKVHILDEGESNSAPTLSPSSVSASSVRMPSSSTYGGVLAGSDGDGDGLVFEISKYPSHGSVQLLDRERGVYVYKAESGYTGRDSFSYQLRDEYGNYAEGEGRVSLKITRYASSGFADTDGVDETAARIVSEHGIMSGTRVGESLCFYPEAKLSREEFVLCAMMCLGVDGRDANEEALSVFADRDKISKDAAPYVAVAYERGMVGGLIVDGELVFAPKDEISIAEAAIFTAAMMGIDDETAIKTSAGIGISSLGRSEIATLGASGIPICIDDMDTLLASEALTRGDGAHLFAAMLANGGKE